MSDLNKFNKDSLIKKNPAQPDLAESGLNGDYRSPSIAEWFDSEMKKLPNPLLRRQSSR